ncbi:3-hydroxyacyl-ACP dehydratase FabZ family protein [Chitinophaga nivalis]|uniref:Beta-hydroxyacyl-ACP dehydratase n=1 Tax=Chitinophaga nivalis TaxID=2991709 RepID=A0ABT3IMK3_9BACT|nr:hypothetical protein [Chitinophaga nivalis]MCW3465099.1 hypothetical protein [Chitinophaga nivalis]MCW3485209.1 hypothetical protein [Chitinophaga nivalis]
MHTPTSAVDIEQLIPHRPPFLFADTIVTATMEEIVGVKTFDSRNQDLKGSFPAYNFIPGTILLESMAQSGGAGVKVMGITDGVFGLAGIETARFLKGAIYDVPVKYVISNIKLSEKIIKQSGIAYQEDVPVMEATWTCIKIG